MWIGKQTGERFTTFFPLCQYSAMISNIVHCVQKEMTHFVFLHSYWGK